MSGQPSDAPSGSGSGNAPSGSKAIGSLAKKPEVTRQGTQKMKFMPTLPVRRKKEEVKPEPTVHAIPPPSERGRGRGRGRGEGRGRGRGAPRPPMEMTASGPFAMGPALAGNNARRVAPRSNFTPTGSGAAAALGAGLSRTAAPTLKREAGNNDEMDEDNYSDPDEGVEIVDMENVRQMDWMAPESLVKDRSSHKKKSKIKLEEAVKSTQGKGKGKVTGSLSPEPDIEQAAAAAGVNLANALDLSDSEEEEELEDLIEDFALDASIEEEMDVRQERLYFFQFPTPFPTFVSNLPPEVAPMDLDEPEPSGSGASKKVSFAPGTKKPSASEPEKEKSPPKVDGVIGQLEIYKSGAVKMRLANGILMDVTAATQPSFLQQAVHLDMENKQLNVIGEVNKRFVVSPNIDTLIAAMDAADRAPVVIEGEDEMITMD